MVMLLYWPRGSNVGPPRGEATQSIDDFAERAGFSSTRQLRRTWGRFNAAAPRQARDDESARVEA